MLAYTLAMRELRGGLRDFRLFLGCLVVGVTVIASVGVMAGRVDGGIRAESRALLGGDVEIGIAGRAATKEQEQFLQGWGRVSLTIGVRAMATFRGDSTLVELKGVDARYPLEGKVELASGRNLADRLGGGRVVVGEDLRERLALNIGESLVLGNTPFTVSDIIRREPDRIAGAFSLGPRVIAASADMEKAGLLLPGSLIRYNYRIALARPARLAAFREALMRSFPKAPWIIKTVNESNRTVQGLMQRLQLFLTLAGLSSLLIGGVGILNATESYIERKSVTIATFKALGATRATVLGVYAWVLLLVALLGIGISGLLSRVLCAALLPYLAQFLPVAPGASGDGAPLMLAAAFGMLTVFTFAYGALSRGVEVRPALLFRGVAAGGASLESPGRTIQSVLGAALVALVLLTSADRTIAAGFVVAALLCFALFTLAARGVRFAAHRLRLPPGVLRLAVASLHRPGAPVFSIMLSIGLGLSVLVALLLVEGNVERDIRESIPERAPSLFLIDIQPFQKDELSAFLAAQPHVSDIRSEPMVRGRIAKLKGVAVEQAPIGDEAKWATESDRGLSFAAMPPEDTQLTQGTWWPAGYRGKPLASLDRKLAEGMGLKVGDTMTLNIMGDTLEVTIANLREVNYMSLHINFALILSPGAIEQFPASYITTLRVEGQAGETELVRALTRKFPNISSIRIRESLAQLDEMVSHILTAVRITALFTLIAGVMVLISALVATLDRRAYDTAMFKVLGARRRDILMLFLIEWLVIAAVTGIIACVFGSVGAWLIIRRMDWVAFHLLYGPIVKAMLSVLAFIAGCGLLLHSRAFALKANVILRNE